MSSFGHLKKGWVLRSLAYKKDIGGPVSSYQPTVTGTFPPWVNRAKLTSDLTGLHASVSLGITRRTPIPSGMIKDGRERAGESRLLLFPKLPGIPMKRCIFSHTDLMQCNGCVKF